MLGATRRVVKQGHIRMRGIVRIAMALLAVWCVPALAQMRPTPEMPPEIVAEQELLVQGEHVRIIQHQGGALCVVCGKAVHAHDRMYLIRGQRVAVHEPGSPCDTAFREDPRRFLAALQPRGAFLGGAPAQGAGFAWFYLGIYVLVGLVFAALCGQLALERGHPQLQWYLAGFFLSLLAYGALRARPARALLAPAGVPAGLGKISSTYAPSHCACGAENHPSAKQCSTCGAELQPQVVSEVARVRP